MIRWLSEGEREEEMGEWVSVCMQLEMNEWTHNNNEKMYGYMDARMTKPTNDGPMEGRMDGWMDGWMDACMDGWMGGWTDGWMD
eukprot:scaffold213052_cov19-Prasinocladus_malaysianus.AAC.1